MNDTDPSNYYSPQSLSQRMFAVDLSMENVKYMLRYQMETIVDLENQIKALKQRIHECEAKHGDSDRAQAQSRLEP